MKSRIITATIGIPSVYLTLWLGFPWIWLACCIISSIAILEFYTLLPNNFPIFLKALGVFIINLLVSGDYLLNTSLLNTLSLALILIFILSFLLLVLIVLKNKIINNIEEPFKLKQNFLNSLYTFLGIIYIGIPISLLLLIRKEADGFALLTVLIFGVFATDTFSFVTGKLLGIHKLASTISPNKTWEGAIGGGVLGFISTICLINILDVFDNFKITVSFAFLLVISAQIGDLLESKFKRMAKVKDTSNIIPGHGGMLDRMDSIILSTVIVYPLIKWSIG